MTMVERMARAIYEAQSGDPAHWELIAGYQRAACTNAAIAALKAMREPSERMLHHMVGYTDFCLDRCFWGDGETDTQRMMAGQRQEMKTAWGVAIDAAIAEHEEATDGHR